MTEKDNTSDTFVVGRDDVGRRLDRLARKFLSDLPLGLIYGAIRRGDIRVDGKKRSGDYRLRPGERLEVRRDLLGDIPSRSQRTVKNLLPPWFTGTVIYENENLLVFNKPRGVLVHGKDSLQTAVLEYLREQRPESLSFTPGPLHRLDRNSSGLVLFGKSLAGAARFTELLRSHRVTKSYLVLLTGELSDASTWEDRLTRDTSALKTLSDSHGRPVVCDTAPLLSGSGVTLAVVSMSSGFTHQIRAQAAIHSHPLVGDRKYGSRSPGPFLLHAAAITLHEEDGVLGFRSLTAPLPAEAQHRLELSFGKERASAALHRASAHFRP